MMSVVRKSPSIIRPTQSIPSHLPSPKTDEAAIEPQTLGKTPELCASNSTFQVALANCEECVAGSNQTSNVGQQLNPTFAQWLNFCATQNDDSPAATLETLLSSKSSIAAAESSIDARIASLQGNSSIASTSATTTLSGDATSATQPPNQITVYATSSNTIPPSSDSPRVSVIVPAVVVPVVVVIVAVVVGAVFLRRRRRSKRAHIGSVVVAAEDEYKGKPELHADEFRPELEDNRTVELDTVKPTQREAAELPAREVVGSEMDAKGRDPTG